MNQPFRIWEAPPEATADLDVGLIYTYERQWMTPLVQSLAHSGNGLQQRLIVVDNASAEGTDEWHRVFPETIVVHNMHRLGYAPNLNRILEASTAPYVLLLNTDMYFPPEEQCLAKMVEFMRNTPQCGLSICRLYHADGEYAYPARKFQSWRVMAGRRLPGGKQLFAKDVDEYLFRQEPLTASYPCDWVSGCFMLIRRETMKAVGPFDVGFGKYFEDVDYCLRVWRAGWEVMFHGETFGYHYEQRASKKLFSRDAWQHFSAYRHWLKKWGMSTPQRTVTTPAVPVRPARAA